MICVLLLMATRAGWAQEVSISISPEIDTLNADLLKRPDDRSLQLQLIQAYTLSFNPELALLEILNRESENKGGGSEPGIKGRVQMSLEQVDPALQSLEGAYLQSPSDETLMLVAVLNYARGDPAVGNRQLKRLKGRSTNLAVDLLRLYERFYLNGRKKIAGAILQGLQETDPVAYRAFFPLPQVSILSPAEDFATDENQTSVIVEVRHTRPLQSVRIGDSLLVDRKEVTGETATETVSRSFSPLIPLKAGRNSIAVTVTDIFGNTSSDTVHVNGMNFGRLASWPSPLADSLRTAIEYLRNYVPDSVLVRGQLPSDRTLIVSAGTGSPEDRGLFLYEFLTNRISGMVPAANTKILVGDRALRQNIGLVCANWLLKGVTFQSTTMVYCSGSWRISDNEWDLLDTRGSAIDMKPVFRGLGSTAAAGAVILIDGTIDHRPELANGLKALVQNATIPLEAIIFGTQAPWPDQLMTSALRGDSPSASSDSVHESLLVDDMRAIVPGSEAFIRSSIHPVLSWNPVGVILRNHRTIFEDLRQKIGREKIAPAIKTKILEFSKDWKRYNEIRRYLSGQLTLADFIVRVEEYESRAGGVR